MSPTWKISRRTALKGVGVAIALPLLETMGWAEEPKARGGGRSPVRTAFIFVPNGVNLDDWRFKEANTSVLPPILQPLAPVMSEVLAFRGLNHPQAAVGGNGAHAREGGTFLTGALCRKTDGADIQAGVSIDQVMAEKIGSYTALPSLELGIEQGKMAGNCDNGYSCAYVSNISWRTPNAPMAKEINPKGVFQRLFAARSGKRRTSAGPAVDASAFAGKGAPPSEAEVSYERSILDHVLADARTLRGNVSGSDQRKLDDYLDSVRAVERRIAHLEREELEQQAAVAEKQPANRSPLITVDVGNATKNYAEHVKVMMDLMILAFQTDATRIVSFMMGNAGSNLAYGHIGVNDAHHELSHHRKDPKKLAAITKINTHHTELLAYMLQKMQGLNDGRGSLLDNSMVLYGSTIADGDRHNNDDIPILLAGRGGGTIRPGRIVQGGGTTLCDLFLAMSARAGCKLDTFGDGKRMLDGLS